MTIPPDAEARAGAVFEALGDPTRREIMREVARRGPVTATELAERVPVTRQAIAKHLTVLLDAGLVAAERAGRERRFSARTSSMIDAGRWLDSTGAAWDDRLQRLATRVEVPATDVDASPGRQ